MRAGVAQVTLAACLLALGPLGCTVGEGEGRVSSDHIWVAGCWNGAFDLKPDFFGVNPDQGESLTIRVQRGDNIEDVSDGLIVLVNDLPEVRKQLGQDLQVGMPRGVSPSGVPVKEQEDPPKISLSLYLHNSCHLQNGSVRTPRKPGWRRLNSPACTRNTAARSIIFPCVSWATPRRRRMPRTTFS